jgi:hypothetical protein
MKRKPILITDGGTDSLMAATILAKSGIEFVEYDIRKFTESCCGDLPTTRAPSVFAPEGVFKGLDGVQDYVAGPRKMSEESAYW